MEVKIIIQNEKENRKGFGERLAELTTPKTVQFIKAETGELPSGVGVFLPKFESGPYTVKERCNFLKEIANKLGESFDEIGLFSDEIETIFNFLKTEFEFKEK